MDRFGLSDSILIKYDVLSYISTTGSRFDFHFDSNELIVLDLGKIHKTLKKQVEKTHKIREQIKITDVKQNNNKVKIEISENDEKKNFFTKYVIDASGNEFFTRKKFNLRCPELCCPCLSASIFGGYKGEHNVITFILPTDQFKSGGWLYPFDNGDYVFGIADTFENMVLPETLERRFNEIQKYPILEDILEEGIRDKWDAGIIPVGFSPPLVFDRICYVGDIIGQVNPWDMNGVRPTLESSIMCANAIDVSLKNNNKSFLSEYQKNWDFTYGPQYSNYDHYRKWTKTTEEWEKTSMKYMVDVFKKYGQEIFLNQLRYYKMPKEGSDYLKKLRSRFCQ
jgi:flavin-dependent dehydrogenase